MRVGLAGVVVAALLVHSAAAKEQIVPISAVANGANNTLFRTDVRVFNPSGVKDIIVEAQFLPINGDGTSVVPRTITVPKRQMLVFDNAVASFFAASGLGAMRFRSDDDFYVTSRTYTDSPNPLAPGTFGQFIPAREETSARDRGVILHLSGSSNLNAGFRANAGIMNPNLTAASVTFRLFSATGTLIKESAPVSVPPRSVIQGGLAALLGQNPLDFQDGYVSFQASVAVIGYASVVDNRSSDQIFVAAADDSGSTGPSSPSLSVNDNAVNEGNSGTTNLVLSVVLTSAASQPVTVQYTTLNNTATAGSDYVAKSGTLNIPAGATSATITVVVNGDTIVESNESFFVTLSNPTNATINDAQATGTIRDDDNATRTLSINDVTLNEGNSGSTNAVFTVTASGTSTSAMTVQYATQNGSASAGSDYSAASGTLTISAGATTGTISVPILGDTTQEPNETFTVNLSNPTNSTIADAQGSGTISNDDNAPVTPSLSINDVTVTEGNAGTVNAVFTVTASASTTQTVTVQYATQDSSAQAGTDYVAKTGSVTINPGGTTGTISIVVNGDTAVETTETFFVNLSSPTNATIGDAQGVGTITNDDSAPVTPSMTIGNVSLAEGNSGTKSFDFIVTLSSATSQTVSVQYVTADGTNPNSSRRAKASANPSDYVSKSGTLIIPPGSTFGTISIVVNGDTIEEAPNQLFSVVLSNPVNATISGSGVANGTIQNDDTATINRTIDVTVYSFFYDVVPAGVTRPSDIDVRLGEKITFRIRTGPGAGATHGFQMTVFGIDTITILEGNPPESPGQLETRVFVADELSGVIGFQYNCHLLSCDITPDKDGHDSMLGVMIVRP